MTEEQPKRHRLTVQDKIAIVECIRTYNGIRIVDVASKLNLDYDKTRNYVNRLVRESIVTKDCYGHGPRYFMADSETTFGAPRDSVLGFIRARPGCTIKQIAFSTGLPYHLVRRHVLMMIASGEIETKGPQGRRRLYEAVA